MRLRDNRAILHSVEHRRILCRVVLQQGRGDGLLAFSLPDTHLHIEALCGERPATRLCQRIETSLKQRLALPVGFVTYPHEPIWDQRHLYNTLRYILTQHIRHGLDLHSFLEATNLPDLLGLRLLGQYARDNIRRHLPRVRTATILSWSGVPTLHPVDGPLDAVVDATLSATALNSLAGSSQPVLEARRALIEVVGNRLDNAAQKELLGVAERTLLTLRHRPVNPQLVQAIRLQLGLRHAMGAATAEIAGPSEKVGLIRRCGRAVTRSAGVVVAGEAGAGRGRVRHA